MDRKKASDFPPEVLKLFDGYVHGSLSRRDFLDRAGGGTVNTMATRMPDLAAAVPYYGPQPPAAEAAKIRSPMLIHYASADERINAGWPAFEAVLKQHGVKYEAYIYPNTQHGFHNDTTPRYDEAAAKLAWQRTLYFFKQNLKG